MIPDDDLICYVDIGCTLNDDGIGRFKEYCALTLEYGSLCFELTHLERKFTKMDTYKKFFQRLWTTLTLDKDVQEFILLRILRKTKISSMR